MIKSNKGALKENFNWLKESVRISPPCARKNHWNLHSIEDCFSEMSKIDAVEKIPVPFLVHQTNAQERRFCKEGKSSQSTEINESRNLSYLWLMDHESLE